MEVAPRIHRIETEVAGRVACVFLVVGEKSALLVDCGLASAPSDAILPYLAQIGCLPEKVEWVVVTHSDFDHSGGGAPLRDRLPNARFACHPAERPQVENVEALIEQRLGEFGRDHQMPDGQAFLDWVRDNVATTTMDCVLTGGEIIDLGGVSLEVIATPGHSAGHLSLYEHESRTAIIADAVLWRTLLYRDGRPAFPPTYRYATAYRATIQLLTKMDIQLLLTSHFDAKRGSDAVAFLDESLAYFEQVNTEVERFLVRQSKPTSLAEIGKALGSSLGPWADDAALLVAWPILGHLESLIVRGKVKCASLDTPRTYQWVGSN